MWNGMLDVIAHPEKWIYSLRLTDNMMTNVTCRISITIQFE
jgi:hypothetical protein